MAKPLVFHANGQEFAFDITKLDRRKLYGWKDITAFDDSDNECLRMELDETGSFIIPPGGKGLGVLDREGNWVDKNQLVALLTDGSPAPLIPSSFDAPVELNRMVTIEEFLDYNIENVYAMTPVNVGGGLADLVREAEGIYSFEFNYRADYEGSSAFLVESKDKLYMLVGSKTAFEYVGLEQTAEVNLEEEKEDSGDDELDFSMM